MLPSRCPHCQEQLPERGRFCVMCGRRVEGWGGLVPAPLPTVAGAAQDAGVPRELPSEYDRTRPAAPSPDLLRSAAEAFDIELLRPTREMPSIGHELRAMAPDHRVHTSPIGNILPAGAMQALSNATDEHKRTKPAPSHDAPRPRRERDRGSDGVPSAPLPDEPTDHIRMPRRSRMAETLHLLLLASVCGSIAVLVGLFAYRLMTRSVDSGALVLEASPERPTPTPGLRARAAVRPRPAQVQSLARDHGAHRTRDLVIPVQATPASRPGGGQGVERRVRAAELPPMATAATPLESAVASATPAQAQGAAATPAAASAVAPAPLPPPVQESVPLTEEEQRAEAEAQMAAADIEFVASAHNGQVRACHERAFKDPPGPGSPPQGGGKVELSFTLNEEGRAVNISTVANTTGSDMLARCLEGRIAEWRFPRPVGGARRYQFPFVFLAAGGR